MRTLIRIEFRGASFGVIASATQATPLLVGSAAVLVAKPAGTALVAMATDTVPGLIELLCVGIARAVSRKFPAVLPPARPIHLLQPGELQQQIDVRQDSLSSLLPQRLDDAGIARVRRLRTLLIDAVARCRVSRRRSKLVPRVLLFLTSALPTQAAKQNGSDSPKGSLPLISYLPYQDITHAIVNMPTVFSSFPYRLNNL